MVCDGRGNAGVEGALMPIVPLQQVISWLGSGWGVEEGPVTYKLLQASWVAAGLLLSCNQAAGLPSSLSMPQFPRVGVGILVI